MPSVAFCSLQHNLRLWSYTSILSDFSYSMHVTYPHCLLSCVIHKLKQQVGVMSVNSHDFTQKLRNGCGWNCVWAVLDLPLYTPNFMIFLQNSLSHTIKKELQIATETYIILSLNFFTMFVFINYCWDMFRPQFSAIFREQLMCHLTW